ncbi:MAG TPA: GNAT family N-acetyltransferase [Rhodothermales bacterium]|nr:GNAT family N-acetyltransferase [Rhodothermales bacterium]
MRRALQHDIPTLLSLMADFYAESGYELDQAHAHKAFAALLADQRLGYIWLLEDDEKEVGYVVLTLRFGMEYGGLTACLDDLFVVPQSRNKGLSTAALQEIRAFCDAIGVCAITVEVGEGNDPAQRVYRCLGMSEARDRQLLVLPLRHPTHAV